MSSQSIPCCACARGVIAERLSVRRIILGCRSPCILSSSTDRRPAGRVHLLRVCGPNLQSAVSKPLFNSHAHLQSMADSRSRDQARERMQRYRRRQTDEQRDRIRERDRERSRLARHAIVDSLRSTEFLEDERQRIARIRTQETPGMRYKSQP